MIFRLIKSLLVIALFFGIVFGAFFFLLSQKALTEKAVPWILNKKSADYQISGLKIGSQSYEYPDILTFKDVSFLFADIHDVYSVTIGQLRVKGEPFFWGPRQNLVARMEYLNVRTESKLLYEADVRASFYFYKFQYEGTKGEISAKGIASRPIEIGEASAKFSGFKGRVRFDDIVAELYRGTVQGRVLYHLDTNFTEMNLAFQGVELGDMRALSPGIFSQMDGKVNGTVVAQANDRTLNFLRANVEAPQGGNVRSGVLEKVVTFMPENPQRKQLTEILQTKDEVFLTRAVVQLFSFSHERLQANIFLSSRDLPMEAEITLDMNIEGGLNAFLNSLHQVQ